MTRQGSATMSSRARTSARLSTSWTHTSSTLRCSRGVCLDRLSMHRTAFHPSKARSRSSRATSGVRVLRSLAIALQARLTLLNSSEVLPQKSARLRRKHQDMFRRRSHERTRRPRMLLRGRMLGHPLRGATAAMCLRMRIGHKTGRKPLPDLF